MIAPGLDTNLDHELNRGPECCDLVTQSDSVGLVNLFTRKKVGGAKAVFTFHPTAGRSPDPARVRTSHRPADSAMGDLCTAQETLIACRLTTNAGIASAIGGGRRRKP